MNENAIFSGIRALNEKIRTQKKNLEPERFSRHFFPMIFMADKHDFHVTREFTHTEKNVGEARKIIHFIFFSAVAWHPNNAKHFRWRFQLSCAARAMKSDHSKERYVSYGPWKIPHERRMRLTKMSHAWPYSWQDSRPQKYVTFSTS